jgi:hypothetical protein
METKRSELIRRMRAAHDKAKRGENPQFHITNILDGLISLHELDEQAKGSQ